MCVLIGTGYDTFVIIVIEKSTEIGKLLFLRSCLPFGLNCVFFLRSCLPFGLNYLLLLRRCLTFGLNYLEIHNVSANQVVSHQSVRQECLIDVRCAAIRNYENAVEQ